MIKKAGIFVLVVSLFLALLSPSLVQAQGGLTISGNSASAEFPFKLHFNLSAKSDVKITDIRLHYTVDHESYAQVTSEVYLEFVPAPTVEVHWTWDMRRTGGLPPGSSVEYWWTVADANGSRVETTPLRVRFDDNRYSWQSLTEGKVTIYWYEGEQSFAAEIMLAAQQALARLAKDTGAYLKKPVRLYIYTDARDLQGAMIFPQEWTGGAAFTRYGVIAIGIAPNNLSWGERAITHELTHLVIYQMTSNVYNDLPTWLNEGLAMYNEGLLEPSYINLLEEAVAEGDFISVRTLSSQFSTDPAKAYLSYAESYSLVEFLIATYGRDKMLELLTTFSQGNGYYDGALEMVYGFNRDGLDTLWREKVTMSAQPSEEKVTIPAQPSEEKVTIPARPSEEKGMPPALVGVLAALATGLLLVLSLAAESWAWRRGW